MATKKSSRAKKVTRKRIPISDPAQSARFLTMAKNLGVDEGGESFERAMDVLVPRKGK